MSANRIEARRLVVDALVATYSSPVVKQAVPDLSVDDQVITVHFSEGEVVGEGVFIMTVAKLTIGFHSNLYTDDDTLDSFAGSCFSLLSDIDTASSPVMGIEPIGFEYPKNEEETYYSVNLLFEVKYSNH